MLNQNLKSLSVLFVLLMKIRFQPTLAYKSKRLDELFGLYLLGNLEYYIVSYYNLVKNDVERGVSTKKRNNHTKPPEEAQHFVYDHVINEGKKEHEIPI